MFWNLSDREFFNYRCSDPRLHQKQLTCVADYWSIHHQQGLYLWNLVRTVSLMNSVILIQNFQMDVIYPHFLISHHKVMNLDKWHTHVVMFSVKKCEQQKCGFPLFHTNENCSFGTCYRNCIWIFEVKSPLQFQHFNFVGFVLVIMRCNTCTYNSGSWQVCFIVGRAFMHN